jgi:hypothetical protein
MTLPPPCPWVFLEGGAILLMKHPFGYCLWPDPRTHASTVHYPPFPVHCYSSSLVTSCCTLLAWAKAAMPVWLRISNFGMLEVAAA